MSVENDGGPAFPCSMPMPDGGEMFASGVTVRDYFAAKAMHADLAYQGLEGREELEHVAKMAYEMADFMLAAREKRT